MFGEYLTFEELGCPDKESVVQVNGKSYRVTEFAIRGAKRYGPQMKVGFSTVRSADGIPTVSSYTGGQTNFYFHNPHVKPFWAVKPHAEIPGYEPLKISDVHELKRGDAYIDLETDELWVVCRAPEDLYCSDIKIAPASNKRRQQRVGSRMLLFASFNNQLYRAVPKTRKSLKTNTPAESLTGTL